VRRIASAVVVVPFFFDEKRMLRSQQKIRRCGLHLMFVAATTMSATGCLHALGLARPSIRPRSASTEAFSDSTVRAQDTGAAAGWDGLLVIPDAKAAANPTNVSTPPASSAAGSGHTLVPSASGTSLNVAFGGHSQSPTNVRQRGRARLLMPQFGAPSPHTSPVAQAGTLPPPNTNSRTAVRPPHVADAEPLSPTATSHENSSSLGFTASDIRAYMNRKSQNEMSEGRVLDDIKPKWNVLSSNASNSVVVPTDTTPSPQVISGHNTQRAVKPVSSAGRTSIVQPPVVVGPGAVAPPSARTPLLTYSDGEGDPAAVNDTLVNSEQAANDVTAAVTPATPVSTETPAVEPSVFDRLKKNIYEPISDSSSSARRKWTRPFQKLSNPWNVFREKDEPSIAEEAIVIPEPTQTVETLSTEAPATPDTQRLLTELIEATTAELDTWARLPSGGVEDLSAYQRRQQDLRLLHLIANQPGSAIQAVEELPPGEQDFWQELMLAMAEYRSDDDTNRETRLTNTSGQLRSAVRQLAPLSTLTIPRFEICSRIHSFGRIDTFPANDFDPGQPILLYAEIENFATEFTTTGRHRTRFAAQLQIFEEGNDKPKESVDLSNITDEATSERSDYYQTFELNLPSHLQSGQYKIRLRLKDRISGKTAEEWIKFQVRTRQPS